MRSTAPFAWWHNNRLSVQSLEDVGGRSLLDIRRGVLNKDALDGVVLDNSNVSLRSEPSEQARSIETETSSLGEGASVVGQEVNVLGVLGTELLLPSLSREGVVDSDDVDVLDTLLLELLPVLDVAWDVRAARGSESAWNADDEVWWCKQFQVSTLLHPAGNRIKRELTLASQLAEVDGRLLRVVLLDEVSGWDNGTILERSNGSLDLVNERGHVVWVVWSVCRFSARDSSVRRKELWGRRERRTTSLSLGLYILCVGEWS